MTLTDRQPTGLRKGLLRAPIRLYRMHLGAVVGHRLVYLASGTAQRPTRRRDAGSRQIHPHPEEIIVVAGWAERADWTATSAWLHRSKSSAAAAAGPIRTSVSWTPPRRARCT